MLYARGQIRTLRDKMASGHNGLTYADAGVDIDAGNALVDRIKPAAKRTQRMGSMGGLGGFGALFDLKAAGYNDPILVAATDGVGTKLRIAIDTGHVSTIGIDLVAMCVNDLVCQGAEPLLFLDYIGIAALDEAKINRLITGMCDYLEACGCILAGGETAEMPGIVPADVIELSGFCIGCAEKPDLIDPTTVAVGDCLIGYASDSIHANGWSLVRRVLKEFPGEVSKDELHAWLQPTRLYHDVVAGLKNGGVRPKAMAHITGGGLPENLERLFRGMGADLEIPKWNLPGIEKLYRHVDAEDRFHTFNMGIGMTVVVDADRADAVLRAIKAAKHPAWILGQITKGSGVCRVE